MDAAYSVQTRAIEGWLSEDHHMVAVASAADFVGEASVGNAAARQVSRLVLAGTGAAQWHSALNKVHLGGGGLQLDDLLHAAAADYPTNSELSALLT